MSKSPSPVEADAGGAGARPRSAVESLKEHGPTIAVLLVLAGVAYWGYRSEWKIPGLSGSRSNGSGGEAKGGGEHEAGDRGARIVPPESPAKDCPLDRTRIEFPSADALGRAGLQVATVREQPMTATVGAPGEIDYDPTLVARLSSPVTGRVWRVEKEVGERVRKGDVLALLDAARVGDLKAEFLQALTQLNLRTTTLENLKAAGGAVPARQVREAEASLRDGRVRLFNAEQALVNLGLPIKGKDVEKLSEEALATRLRFLGLPESVAKSLDPETATSNLLPLTAPFDGLVAERAATPGEVVDPTRNLFVVADLRRVWIVMGVRLEDADRLAVGQPVDFQPDGHPDEVLRGKLSWISTSVDEKTRSMRARAVVDNPKEHFRARTFGTARITIRDAPKAVTVPGDAIQREGRCRFVFVRLTDTVFQVRQVRAGVSSGGLTEVLEGVRPGEVVATTGSFLLKSEVLKGRLGGHAD
ncbi:MAG: efflux RND transporter periplasmic adaptor subunit [Gemmataceae bacterium]|nr:efflux RND transporter periplasmic adaptor subunit [Gemmataceae bacterium]